jgi:GntR family transcriptional regulator
MATDKLSTPAPPPLPAAPPQRADGGARADFEAYLVLRRRLLVREFPPELPLPSGSELAARLGLPPAALHGALARLEEEKLLERRQGAGPYPGDLPAADSTDSAVRSLQDQLAGPVETPRKLRLLGFQKIPPPPSITGLANFGAWVLQVQRLGFHGTRPAHRVTSYVHEEFAARIDPESLGTRTVLEVLEEGGIALGRGQVTVTAAAADDVVANQLGLHVGAPLLVTRRLTLMHDGRPVEYFEGLSRPDEYCLQFVTGQARTTDPSIAGRGPVGKRAPRNAPRG